VPDIPAQPKLTRAEAARLNGAKSRGLRTPEGKARSARNALKHGLTAQAFALLPGEDAHAYHELLDGLARRYRPKDELAAHPVQRLASVMWRQQRADRLEAEVLTQLEQRHDSSYIGGYVPSSPHAWDAARFNAVQRQQARLDRTFFKLLDELDRLTPAEKGGKEWPNEPEGEATAPAAPANDDTEEQNEPNKPAAATMATPPAAALAAGSPLPRAPAPEERAAAERLLAEGRVEPVNDFLRAMLANKRGGGLEGA
jgi:hypothetical protein